MKKPISKIVTKAIIKQETLDAVEAFASTSKPKQKVKVDAASVKKETVVTADTEIKQEKIKSVATKSPKSKTKPKAKSEVAEIKTETVDTAPVAKEPAAKVKWQPKNWQQMIENIREMRKNRPAPVDTMGCHKCSDETAPENVIFLTFN